MREPEVGAIEDRRSSVGLLAELRDGARPVDLLLLGSVPLLLVAVFVLFGGSRDRLVLSIAEPTSISVVTTHFVHLTADHLVANLAAYCFIVPVGYVLAAMSARREEFLVSFVGLLLALPPALSGLNLLVFDRGVSLGFSGMTMAFVGLLPLYLGAFVARPVYGHYDRDVSPGLFFLGLGFIAARSVPAADVRRAVLVSSVLIALVYLRSTLPSSPLSGRSLSAIGSREGQLAVTVVGVFLLGLVIGFPGELASGTVVVNTYGHLLGYAFGFIVPYSTFRVLGMAPIPTGGPA